MTEKGKLLLPMGRKKGEIKFCFTTREIPLSTGTVFREGGLHINFDFFWLYTYSGVQGPLNAKSQHSNTQCTVAASAGPGSIKTERSLAIHSECPGSSN